MAGVEFSVFGSGFWYLTILHTLERHNDKTWNSPDVIAAFRTYLAEDLRIVHIEPCSDRTSRLDTHPQAWHVVRTARHLSKTPWVLRFSRFEEKRRTRSCNFFVELRATHDRYWFERAWLQLDTRWLQHNLRTRVLPRDVPWDWAVPWV